VTARLVPTEVGRRRPRCRWDRRPRGANGEGAAAGFVPTRERGGGRLRSPQGGALAGATARSDCLDAASRPAVLLRPGCASRGRRANPWERVGAPPDGRGIVRAPGCQPGLSCGSPFSACHVSTGRTRRSVSPGANANKRCGRVPANAAGYRRPHLLAYSSRARRPRRPHARA
jgi:hypothetical protein